MTQLDNFKGNLHVLTKEDSVLGGKAKSPRKRMSSILNSMLSNPNCTPEKAYLLTCLKDGQFEKLLKELMSLDLLQVTNEKTRARMQDLLVKLLPSKNLNLNVDVGQSGEVQQTTRDVLKDIFAKLKEGKDVTASHVIPAPFP